MGPRFATFRNWTKRWFGDHTPPTARPARSRPNFVQLEDRLAPATFIVTNVLDSTTDFVGGLSLRQAILAANTNPGFDRIEFRIPTSPSLPTLPNDPFGKQRYFPIVLATTLPDLTDPAGVMIDATTQPRDVPPLVDDPNNPDDDPTQAEIDAFNFANTRPIVQLLPDPNPGAFPDKTGAIRITGQNNTIRGLVFTGFPGSAVNIIGPNAKNNTVVGSWFNTSITGEDNWVRDPIIKAARPPALEPERSNSLDFVLGGITFLGGANNNVVGGMFDLEGRSLVDAGGQLIGDGGTIARYKVGGTSLEKDAPIPITPEINRNVISGTPEFRKDYFRYIYFSQCPSPIKFRERDIEGAASGPGIRLMDPGTTFNLIQANYIGTDHSGEKAIPNVNGIEIYNAAASNYVGNPVVPGFGNKIRFNELDGIRVAAHSNPSMMTTREVCKVNPSPFDEGDDVTTVDIAGNAGQGVVPVPGGYGPVGNSAQYSAPFYDAYNANYFVGATPQGGNIITLATGSFGGFPQVGVESQVGTLVTLRGANLAGTTAVNFNKAGGGLVQGKFTVLSDSEVEVIIPEGAVNGPIAVSTPSGVITTQLAGLPDAVILPSPQPTLEQVSEFFPSSGVVGTKVTIAGTNLIGTQQVLIGGTPVSKFDVFTPDPAFPNKNEIQALVPIGAKTGPINIVTPGGGASTTRNFVVLTEPPPIITGVFDAPTEQGVPPSKITSAVPGQQITLQGTGFTGAFLVTFAFVGGGGGFSTTDFTVVDPNTIVVTVPPNALASPIDPATGRPQGRPIQVSSAGGFGLTSEILPDGFVISPPLTPANMSVEPGTGVVGSRVTITGDNLLSVNAVTFNAAPSPSFKVLDNNTIEAIVPLNGEGVISVSTSAGKFAGPAFDVVDSKTPTADPLGKAFQNTVVTVTGTGLLGVSRVLFGDPGDFFGIRSPRVVEFPETKGTKLEVTIPVGASTGPVFIFTPGGTATTSYERIESLPPTINLAPLTDPVSGVIGQELTIRGTGLLGTQQVFFQKSGGGTVTSPRVTVVSDTEILTVVPQGATSGGVFPRSPGGAPMNKSRFVLVESPNPTIVSYFPQSGPVGTNIRVTGSGLTGASTVTIGGAKVTNFTTLGDTQLEFRVPAGAKDGKLVITTIPGKAVTSGQAFDVTPSPLPVITFSTPGSVRNGTVEISGFGLAGTTQVIVGGAEAKFEVRSDVLLVATVPLTANSGTVSLTSPGGSVVSPTPFQILNAAPPALISVGQNPPVSTDDVGVVGSKFFIDGAHTVVRDNNGNITEWKSLESVFRVEVGGVPAKFEHVGFGASTKLLVTVPVLPSGQSYTVAVFASAETVAQRTDQSFQSYVNFLNQSFVYGEKIQVLPNAAPTVGGITVTDASLPEAVRGAPVRITGNGFTGAQLVQIGNAKIASSQFTVVNDNAIDTRIPVAGLPGVGEVAGAKVTVVNTTGSSKQNVTIDIAETAPLAFTAPSVVILQGQTLTLTATSGTFYEVRSMDVGAVDLYSGRVYGSGPTPATLFRDLDDPAPFQNFVVLPGTGGKQAKVTIPTTEAGSALGGFGKIDAGPDNQPARANITIFANRNDAVVTSGGKPQLTNLDKTPAIQTVTFLNTEDFAFNRRILIVGKTDDTAAAVFTVRSVQFDAKDAAGNNTKIIIPRDNLLVTGSPFGVQIEVTMPTTPANAFGAGVFFVPTGNVTIQTVEGDANSNAKFQAIQPTPQMFQFLTAEAPAFGNVFVENLVYDNGWVVDAQRVPTGPRTQANKFTAGVLGIDFVTPATGAAARAIPFQFGYRRIDQPGPGNHGRGGLNDGFQNSFPSDAGVNTFNNHVGGSTTGPNLLQNFPLLQVVQSSIDRSTFSTALIAKPFRVYRIDYFWNAGFDDTDQTAFNTTNAGIAKEYLGSKVVTTDAQGNGSVNFTVFVKQPEPVIDPDTGQQVIDENGNPVFAPIPDPVPGEFRLPNNRPLPISSGGKANSTNFSKLGVVTSTASDMSAPTNAGPTITDGPDGTSRLSFFRRVDSASGYIEGRVINDLNRNGVLDPNETGAEGFRVQLFIDQGNGALSRLPVDEQVVGPDGFYVFGPSGNPAIPSGLPNGTHRIVILPPANTLVTFINPPEVNDDNFARQDVIIVDQNKVLDKNFFIAIDGTVPPTVPPGVPPTVPPDFGPLTSAIAAGTDEGGGPIVNVYNSVGGDFRYNFFAYDQTFTGGVRTAVADVDGDGNQDIITAPGPGIPGLIKIFNGRTNELIGQFQPYEDAFTGGVYVAAGDLDGDKRADIVTGTGLGGGPRVQIFRLNTNTGGFDTLANFFPYEDSFRGGVLVAAGDLNGDNIAEIVTGTGIGGGPRIQVFDGKTLPADGVSLSPLFNFFAYENQFRGGVFASIGDVDGDGRADIVAGTGVGGGPVVRVFKQTDLEAARTPEASPVQSFFAYDPLFRGGVRVDTADADGDGRLDIITSPGPGMPPDIRALDFFGPTEIYRIQAFDPGFLGGVFIGGTHK